MDWSPPGLPGGGMTGIGPPGGVGCLISGSTCCGGQITPCERASLSLKFPVASRSCWSTSLPLPIVVGVSEAQPFGSSCSVMGATGALVAGGACPIAGAGASSAAIVKPRMRNPPTIARSRRRVYSAGKITAWREAEFHMRCQSALPPRSGHVRCT